MYDIYVVKYIYSDMSMLFLPGNKINVIHMQEFIKTKTFNIEIVYMRGTSERSCALCFWKIQIAKCQIFTKNHKNICYAISPRIIFNHTDGNRRIKRKRSYWSYVHDDEENKKYIMIIIYNIEYSTGTHIYIHIVYFNYTLLNNKTKTASFPISL